MCGIEIGRGPVRSAVPRQGTVQCDACTGIGYSPTEPLCDLEVFLVHLSCLVSQYPISVPIIA
eukprot:3940750-Rhodomonas_salina.1